jgi:hypothetical protein
MMRNIGPIANPFEDDGRWMILSARFDTSELIRDEMRRMMRDFVNSLPVDSPARLLWAVLPQAPGWGLKDEGGR